MSDQKDLELIRDGPYPTPDILLEKIQEKREECVKRHWTLYTNSKGEKIKIRDVLDKVSNSIKIFRDIGDVAIQYDVGHASLPWAAVRLFLQVSGHLCVIMTWF